MLTDGFSRINCAIPLQYTEPSKFNCTCGGYTVFSMRFVIYSTWNLRELIIIMANLFGSPIAVLKSYRLALLSYFHPPRAWENRFHSPVLRLADLRPVWRQI